jgi:hypothetical protein
MCVMQKHDDVKAEQAGLTVLDNYSANIDGCDVYGGIDVSEIDLVTDVREHGANVRIFRRQ